MNHLSCGTSRIVGCRFSIYPMSDRFVDIILGALRNTDLSKVWSHTDDVSTWVRGRSEHVFDVVQSIFLHSAAGGEHAVLNATFSIGCPGDTQGDAFISTDDMRMNAERNQAIPLQVAAHFALYPLGTPDYMDTIYEIIGLAKEEGTFDESAHYASRLEGEAQRVFATLEHAFNRAQKTDKSHVVMTTTISANSPSTK
ncbi:Ykof family thiamine-binding protein [Paenibacillus alvei]|uniref:YkoF family thiamine/hydroxymethylpyrimidine-binding protein n=1 Tax=Paenibacillus TaxID=44249 RepID=UPI000287C92E|nr:YkoF family thiamine/hydroxymethylpyrimidine-binding protein [Paenibacillus alvei]EJW14548.1 putative HMP/thiamine-binding protein YkoF [Paenibacillus alvei DSM 29]MCY9542944.1 Ykof family thiamine-binding protein [Paenibacillus alvei]MCY9706357.1 Ykof family thiamine-binding protein [Paenibacillus alvei]MCY9737132.1 Ykof family thiamine-binding protein [Paenibacillus alvei]MCY9757593.1 Ykof family thiamine-binding protein [Paenibacillus alvei]